MNYRLKWIKIRINLKYETRKVSPLNIRNNWFFHDSIANGNLSILLLKTISVQIDSQ